MLSRYDGDSLAALLWRFEEAIFYHISPYQSRNWADPSPEFLILATKLHEKHEKTF